MAISLRAVLLAAALLAAAGCGESPNIGPQVRTTPTLPPLPTPTPVGLQTPPPNTAYLGAYVPQSKGGTASLEVAVRRKMAFDVDYENWITHMPNSQANDDVVYGRLYFATWQCGVTDTQIVNGSQDMLIVTVAQAIQRYGHTVFLRLLPDHNMSYKYRQRQGCWNSLTDNADGTFNAQLYVQAWQHIHQLFTANGVNNVIWVWAFQAAGSDPGPYYPGDAYVDWVGIDAFASPYNGFAASLSGAYATASAHGKPVVVSEAGAPAANQADYFTGAATTLKTQFPMIRGYIYYDSVDPNGTDWSLGTNGQLPFSTFANDPYLMAWPASV